MRTVVLLAIFALALLLHGCSNPQKMIYQGRYDEVISKLSRKMKKSLKRKPSDVQALEDAFNKANAADLRAIEALKAENNDANWARINDLYKKIQARQEKLTPLIPIKDKNGRQANIVFFNLDQARAESQQKAAEYNYNRGVSFLNEAKQQNRRPKAREAYNEFVAVERLSSNYKETAKLKEEARVFGTVYMLQTVADNSGSGVIFNKNSFSDSLFIKYKADEWTKTDYTAKSNQAYNYELSFIIRRLSLSDINSKDNSLARSIAVDTTINGVKQKVTVSANVIERKQKQTVTVEGVWQIVDKSNGQLICDNVINKVYVHNYSSVTYTGDARALTSEDVEASKRSPNFPSRDLVMQAAARSLQETIWLQCNWAKP